MNALFLLCIAGASGILRVRSTGRPGRSPHRHTDSEAGEPTERGRFVQLRLRERGRHVQDRDQISVGRGVRQVRLRGRDGQAEDRRVRRVRSRFRAGRHRHHRAATRPERRLQRPAQGPIVVVAGRLRRRTVPRGPERVLQDVVVGRRPTTDAAQPPATATAPPAATATPPTATAAATAIPAADGTHCTQATAAAAVVLQRSATEVPVPSVRAQLRSRVRIVLHLVHGKVTAIVVDLTSNRVL